MIAIAAVSPIADNDEINGDEDVLTTPRIKDEFSEQNKAWINYSLKIFLLRGGLEVAAKPLDILVPSYPLGASCGIYGSQDSQ
jgi:hypothetical protein